MSKITYKGKFGIVTEDIKYNNVNLPNLMETSIYTGYHTPKVNDVVFLSSCEIPYHNNWKNSWHTSINNDEIIADVIIELIEYDDSNYDSAKCRNGGKYLDSTWIIREIKGIRTFAEEMER